MNITGYVSSQRDSGLLLGDYHTYQAQATRRIRSLRKRVGQATPKGRKYSPKTPITAVDIAQNDEYVVTE
jgi:signal recognition particle subunit SRP68